MAKVIRSFNTALGGSEFRATSDGTIVRVQERRLNHARFYTKFTMSVEQYEKLEEANAHQIDNPYWLANYQR